MQLGFRAKYSTETANNFFIENIKTFLDKGGVVGAVFLDLKKAFDTVNHRILMSKLSCFNFSSHTLNWIESYSQVHKYWDIDTILTFLALYTTTMDFK